MHFDPRQFREAELRYNQEVNKAISKLAYVETMKKKVFDGFCETVSKVTEDMRKQVTDILPS